MEKNVASFFRGGGGNLQHDFIQKKEERGGVEHRKLGEINETPVCIKIFNIFAKENFIFETTSLSTNLKMFFALKSKDNITFYFQLKFLC